MKINLITIIVETIFTTFICHAAHAACELPVPDMWTKVSDRNLAGYLTNKWNNEVTIKEYKSKKLIKVDISEIDAAYSAYGGDEKISDLTIGIAVRIWYKNCGKPVNNPPKVAYFEFFSNNIKDQPYPLESYFNHRGR
jgi:hypothetical protein